MCLLQWPPMIPTSCCSTPLCNSLPVSVDGVCYLLLTKKKKKYGKGDGMSLPWLGYKWLWLLSCNRLYLLTSQFACFDEVSGHVGETESSLSQQPAENRMPLTTIQWACKEVNIQVRLKTLGQHLDCSLIEDHEAGDPSKPCLDSRPTETASS